MLPAKAARVDFESAFNVSTARTSDSQSGGVRRRPWWWKLPLSTRLAKHVHRQCGASDATWRKTVLSLSQKIVRTMSEFSRRSRISAYRQA
jgi:hypothetical protein